MLPMHKTLDAEQLLTLPGCCPCLETPDADQQVTLPGCCPCIKTPDYDHSMMTAMKHVSCESTKDKNILLHMMWGPFRSKRDILHRVTSRSADDDSVHHVTIADQLMKTVYTT